MKILNVKPPEGLFGRVVASALLFLSLAVAAPFAHALTSGNATIFNEATVSYTSGLSTLTASDDVSVTVATLAAAPTVTVNTTAQTTDAGQTVNYVYTVRSNSNGVDSYTVAVDGPNTTDANVSAQGTGFTGTNPMSLWGGIVLSSGAGTINLPGGSTTGLANGDTVQLTVAGNPELYTVTITNAGSAQTAVAAEVQAVLTMSPVGAAPAITALNVTSGAQVGEVSTIQLDVTAGTPTTPGTDGTHVTNLTFTTTATNLVGSAEVYATSGAIDVTTTVNSPAISIAKLWRNASEGGTTFAAPGNNPKPGQVIEYQITVTGDPAATVTNVYLTDTVPAYTAILTGQYAGGNDVSITYTDVAGAGANSYSVTATISDGDADQASTPGGATAAGTVLTVTVGDTAGDATVPTGGFLDANDTAVVLFQVTVQ